MLQPVRSHNRSFARQRRRAGTEASVEYIQSYRGTPDTLDASLERIRATAQRLIAELDAIRFDVERDPDPA